MRRGYLRVSTDEQSHQRQLDGLQSRCDEVYLETVSATAKKRPVYQKLMRKLKKGDTLVVWDLDRAFRSTLDALNEVKKLRARGIEFKIVTLCLDTATPSGKLCYTVMAAFGEFERENLIERTKQGMESARKQGKQIGRPFKLSPGAVSYAYFEIQSGRSTVMGMAERLDCSRNTLSRAMGRFEFAN